MADARTLCYLVGDRRGRDDRGLRVDHRGIGLHAASVDSERIPAAAEFPDIDTGLARDLLEETQPALEDRRRTGQAVACQQRGEHRVARGFAITESFPVG